MNTPVYLDYNATAPVRPEARRAVSDALDVVGNASSIHRFGQAARKAVERAREQVAALCGALSTQIVFTSGATEANNAVLKAFAGERVLVSAIEHPSVLEAALDADIVPVGADGLIDLDAFEAALKTGTPPALLSVMLVNNETGIIQPVAEIAKRARAIHPGIFIHTDAVQGAGRIHIDMPALRVDYLTLSAHKIGGPQGVGALIAAPGARPMRLLHGGGQEKRQRAGTENVAGITGFGAAAAAARRDLVDMPRLAELRAGMERDVLSIEPRARVISMSAPRVANTSVIALPGVPAETQLMILDVEGIAVSSGAACSSGTVKASHVLQAMSLPETVTGSALRVSTGWATTADDIARFTAAWRLMQGRVKDRITG